MKNYEKEKEKVLLQCNNTSVRENMIKYIEMLCSQRIYSMQDYIEWNQQIPSIDSYHKVKKLVEHIILQCEKDDMEEEEIKLFFEELQENLIMNKEIVHADKRETQLVFE